MEWLLLSIIYTPDESKQLLPIFTDSRDLMTVALPTDVFSPMEIFPSPSVIKKPLIIALSPMVTFSFLALSIKDG